MIKLSLVQTAWGTLGMATTERGICGLTLPETTPQAAMAGISGDFPEGQDGSGSEWIGVVEQLHLFFAGERVCFKVPLDLPAKPAFWRRVWDAVATVPYGETRSYGSIAIQAGAPGGARAVGQAMAHNPVPIIIPCHRVVGTDGRLTGFGGGLEMKRRLLAMELGVSALICQT